MKYLSNAFKGPRVEQGLCSKENQDLFALCVLDGKRDGVYLDIGAYMPIHHNNTYLLEYEFSWSGVSVEIDGLYVDEFNKVRINPCVQADATTLDYTALLEKYNLGPHIDYLSIDIDPAHQSFAALKAIDLDRYSFSVITFEHEAYHSENKPIRSESRELLRSLGYTLVLSDVVAGGIGAFEDWYVNEKYMVSNNWERFIGNNITMSNHAVPTHMMDTIESMLQEMASRE